MSVAGLRDGALVDPAEVTTTSWSRPVQLSAEVPVANPRILYATGGHVTGPG
jgi:hypothetical protein